MERGRYVAPYRSEKTSASFKAEVTKHVTTFTPSTAKPGDILCIDFPIIENELVTPGSLALTFDLDINLDPSEPGNEVKNFPVNNLAANIVSDFKVKVGSEYVFALNYAYLYNTYKDLWLTPMERKNAIEQGIQGINLRKLRTDLGTTFTTGSTPLSDAWLKNMFGKRYKIPINFEMISAHMPISGKLLEQSIAFEIKINEKKYVLNYETEANANFLMKKICLEFETTKCPDLYTAVERELTSGCQFLFDHVHHYKREEIRRESTFLNVEISGVDRKSLKGILLIFEEEPDVGKRDSEMFMNPAIKSIKYTIDGLPNKHYSCDYKEWDQWNEISKHFMREDLKQSQYCNMDLEKYHGYNKFALWTDLRSTEDNSLHGSGKAHNSKHAIKMEVTKNKHTDGKYIMHIYIVSDARIIIKDKKLLSFDL